MLARLVLKRRARQDGESPFWISYSDLMSALMILFLVVMAVTLIAVTKSVTAEEEQKFAANPQRAQSLRDEPGWWFRPLQGDPRFRQLVGVRN